MSSGAEGGGSGSKASDDGKSESDRRYEESGEYDTQDKYKRVGNPISWANPTGGGTTEDNSSKHWTWVYPAGALVILLLCLNSRRKNMKKEQEAELEEKMDVKVPDMSRFSTPAYRPEEARQPAFEAREGSLAGGLSPPPDSLYGGGSGSQPVDSWNVGGGFSAPPGSASSDTWTSGR